MAIDPSKYFPVERDREATGDLCALRQRLLQSLQVDCLDHFLVFGEKHLDYLLREYVEHYHTERRIRGWRIAPFLANRRQSPQV